MANFNKGGARPGAGRKRGQRNKFAVEAVEAAKKSGELPHEFLLRVSRGEKIDKHKVTFAERMTAAKDAAPYYAPKQATLEVSGQGGGPIEHRISNAKASLARKLARYITG